MSLLRWTAEVPPLRSPILVTAFEGQFDVGGAATGALAALRKVGGVEVGEIDPDQFFDFSELRPEVRIGDDGKRVIEWPDHRVFVLPRPDQPRDLVLLSGVEPHLLWRTFADTVCEVAERVDAALVLTLGAMVSEVPHTRPPAITGSTSDSELAKIMRLEQPTYEGPTGVIGVLTERLEQREIPAVSLRASVPHYVSGSPNPKASLALLERFERVTGLETGWADLRVDSVDWELKVDEAMDEDEEVVAYVRRLEERYDEQAHSSLPDGDDLAAEFERYLRQQDH